MPIRPAAKTIAERILGDVKLARDRRRGEGDREDVDAVERAQRSAQTASAPSWNPVIGEAAAGPRKSGAARARGNTGQAASAERGARRGFLGLHAPEGGQRLAQGCGKAVEVRKRRQDRTARAARPTNAQLR